MAVYTQVAAETLGGFLSRYDVGTLTTAKGIAEGVENSNYFVETTRGRFVLTLYERRVAEDDLPYFLALMTHLADRGLPVPRPVVDRDGVALQRLAGRPACLIEFLPGISLGEPTPAHCRAAAEALGRMHGALRDFALERPNALGADGWRRLADACRPRADEIAPGLADEIDAEIEFLAAQWPHALDRSTIHADLFPDNVLVTGTEVSGLIDFYFACTDVRAYDLAVMHSAWTFSADGATFHADRAAALDAGYAESHGLSRDEAAALPILCRGACLRFLLTRSYDWLNTPADALVTRKDPLAYLRRLDHYRQAA
jgi:homoserine kinase type II